MAEYLHIGNKRKKEHGLLVSVNKSIVKYCKKTNIDKTTFAINIGLASDGSLLNKLKRSREDTDITITELIHIAEITGDYEPLRYLNEMFGFVMINTESENYVDADFLDIIADQAQIEANEFFAVTKKANADKKISVEEKESMLKEGMEAITKLNEQLETIKKIIPFDLELDDE
ncbi:phage regulatory CII family protein [Aliarcobacter lanthieri]|uniref:phage regulatory CII family protein n=1 Tax=Aliarcobacter lanthieri TaxID=1355374 RepID=UPI00047D76FF|nr:phage regulatory CII family protein [Aliarcobacter lanthieri]